MDNITWEKPMKRTRESSEAEAGLFSILACEAEPSSSPADDPKDVHLETRELEEAVSRRTRNLLVPEPILDFERTKSKRDTDFSSHDFRLLCLVVLDTVIDRMGFGSGAT